MQPIHIGYHKLVHEDGHLPELGFECSPDDVRPRWPDPAHPQQVHLDIEVPDVDAAVHHVVGHGARRLASFDDHVVCEDAVGHPFCLYRGEGSGAPARIVRIVFDCLSPRALARFYAELLDLPARVVDTTTRVEIAGGGHAVALAFQHSTADPPRWPDPSRPPQLHLDVVVDRESDRERAERLGAMRLPLPERPDNHVYADPAGHPFCLGVTGDGWSSGPQQVDDYRRWLAEGGEATS
jgi:hypothetical protein